MKQRKLTAIIILLIITFNIVHNVSAYDYPSSFWDINSKYEAAVKSQNYSDIIKYGEQIIALMSSTAEDEKKRNIIVPRYREIGNSYAALGNYERSAKIFEKLYNYASPYPEYWEYAKSAKSKILQYTSDIRMYTDGGVSTYYGAKNEKINGVLFGMCSNSATRNKLTNESMVLIYQEFGEKLLEYNKGILRNAELSGCAVEYALNCPKEGTDIKNIKNMTSYLKEISDLLKDYSDIPIYLRFAAEFDIWENQTDAESFKAAFRYVSKYFKDRNPNTAIVWSPTSSSNWYVNIDDYYPGDEYVDWVGLSLYAQKYFLGDKNSSGSNQIFFKTGINSDPVLAVKNIIEKYGDKKPIMISEFGCGHTLIENGRNIEDTSDFALKRLKEYMNYLPMVYPQIKLMAYFDWYVENEKNDYRLSTNLSMQNEYLQITKGSRFIQDNYSGETDFCYRQITDGTYVNDIFPVYCYAHKYNSDIKKVTYYIDGNYVGESSEIPYTVFIDAGMYSGKHQIKADAEFTDGQKLVAESNININQINRDIIVKISGSEISFDQNPILYNNRTLVPMRKIFEKLGADVIWDNNTKTASGRRGDRTVKVSVGSNVMYVNNKQIILDTPPILLSDRTLVPVRAVSEGMGCDVDWIEKTNTVTIEPKRFQWSEWEEILPGFVQEDLYYIEKRIEYRYRNLYEQEIKSAGHMTKAGNFSREEKICGDWSEWSSNKKASFNPKKTEEETRTKSEPEKYHFAHYCTGYTDELENRFRSSAHNWHDECVYHDLGWFDSMLPPDNNNTNAYIQYDSEGNKVHCDNNCYRWYLIEKTGGENIEYRYRDINYIYYFWVYNDWSDWSVNYPLSADDIEERVLYRYKEK